ncbi:MAG: four helix bundle suffix domain-containing protein [bacterium]|nr:four helix bundle suffix domain-containing protein [bacterium]
MDRSGRHGHHGQEKDSSIASSHAAIAANASLVLIGAATALLDRQLAAQAQAFETEGGFTERLYRTRHIRRCST